MIYTATQILEYINEKAYESICYVGELNFNTVAMSYENFNQLLNDYYLSLRYISNTTTDGSSYLKIYVRGEEITIVPCSWLKEDQFILGKNCFYEKREIPKPKMTFEQACAETIQHIRDYTGGNYIVPITNHDAHIKAHSEALKSGLFGIDAASYESWTGLLKIDKSPEAAMNEALIVGESVVKVTWDECTCPTLLNGHHEFCGYRHE